MASYSGTIDLRVTGNAEQKAELIKKRISEIKSIAKSLKPVPNLFDRRGNDATVKAKEDLKRLVEQYGKGIGTGNRFSNTIAGLNQQLNGFNRVLSNVNVGSNEFVFSLTASEKASRRLARAEAERLSVLNKINTSNTVGRAGSVKEILDLSKVIPKSVAGLEFYQQQLQDTLRTVNIGSSDYRELAAAIASVNQQLSVAQSSGRIQGPALPPGFNERGRIPSGGGGGRKGSRFQDIATGAGFPLLFGGGPIQALAGGIGGAAGGLGGSIAASALVAQFEAFAKGAAEAGVALTSTSGALELVREKSLFTSEKTKNYAAQLEKQGDAAGLAKLLTEELVSQIGNAGVIALQDLGTTTNETTKLWGQLTTQLQILIAGPLNGFLKLVNNMIGGINDALKPTAQDDFRAIRDRVLASGDAEAIARVTAIEDQVRGVQRKNLRGGKTQITQGGLTEERAAKGVDLLKAAGFGPKIAVTEQDLQTITPGGGRAKKDVVPGLKIQVQLQERLLALNTKILEAKRNGNEGAAAVLEVEKIFEQTAANINKIRTEGLGKEAESLKIESEQLKGLQKVEAVNNRMKDAKAKEAEKVEELVGNLENEGALINAKLNGREDEVKLTQEIAEKTEGLEKADATRVENLIRGNAELEKQAAIADRMQQIYDQIGQSIASGVVDTLSAAVDQTKSLADAAANTLRNVANILLQLGVNTALKSTGAGLFSGLSGFANGGRPPVGKPSIVGERGPELFVPNTSGTIVPNNKLSGGGATNVVVNVDAKGSSASGDSGAGKQLGGLIGAAVQAELIKQQRPGGLLSR